jgi:hypothetical protein
MNMKMVMIAALVAAQLPAAGPAQAAESPGAQAAAQQPGALNSVEGTDLRGEQTALLVGGAPVSSREAAQEDEPRKKRKSTGDKVLTGAAVVLGVGALAVGGLLVAIFVN